MKDELTKSEAATSFAKYFEKLPRENCNMCKGKKCLIVAARSLYCEKCDYAERFTMEGDFVETKKI